MSIQIEGYQQQLNYLENMLEHYDDVSCAPHVCVVCYALVEEHITVNDHNPQWWPMFHAISELRLKIAKRVS